MSVEEFVSILYDQLPNSRSLISIKPGASSLPLAYDFEQRGLDFLLKQANLSVSSTPIQLGVMKSAKLFQGLHSQGLLSDKDLFT